MLKIVFEVKIYKNIRIRDTKPNSVSTSTLLCVASNMKKSSHKTWKRHIWFWNLSTYKP